MITAEKLRELTEYDPVTGIFVWRKKAGHRIEIGARVGNIKSNGYYEARIDNNRVHLHRMAWLYVTGEHPQGQIDHINGDRSDNRFCNLRVATNGQNQQNARLKKTNKSGYKGVYWHSINKAWVACICIDRKSKYLGSFKTPEEAHDAWVKAASYRGEFLRTA